MSRAPRAHHRGGEQQVLVAPPRRLLLICRDSIEQKLCGRMEKKKVK